MVEILRHEDFAPHEGKTVRFRGWHGALRLVSATLTRTGGVAPGVLRRPFTVLFRGPRNDILAEGLHVAEIEDGPVLEFYIAPIHTPALDRQEYQAVFN